MSDAVERLAPAQGDPPDRAAAAIRAHNDAVIAMVLAVRELGDDRLDEDNPTRAWLGDWETLVQAREEQADVVETGSPVAFDVPQTEDGFPITGRMSEAIASCGVPASLLASWP